MTRRSITEYAEAIRGRYFRASKKAKTEMLNEFVATTRMHRKPAIARRFYPGSKCWRLYFRIQRILIELGFEYGAK